MILINEPKCDFCGTCVAACPEDTIELSERRIAITDGCTSCGRCVWVCPLEVFTYVRPDGRAVIWGEPGPAEPVPFIGGTRS